MSGEASDLPRFRPGAAVLLLLPSDQRRIRHQGQQPFVADPNIVTYSSHSYFTESFRRAFGLTPSEVRRSLTSTRVRALASRLPASSTRQPGHL